ncbi:MAG: flagellar biosynthetic protein FliR [Rhizomicrobium sp.]
MPRPVDPTQHEQGAVIGNFLRLLGAVLIFATDLHHVAIGAIAGSYKMLPPGAALPTGDMAELTIRLVTASFVLGFQLAAPFLVFGFALYAALGILAKLMPQLQCSSSPCRSTSCSLRAYGAAARLDDDAVPQLLRQQHGGLLVSHGRRPRSLTADRTAHRETAGGGARARRHRQIARGRDLRAAARRHLRDHDVCRRVDEGPDQALRISSSSPTRWA